jgi:Reverse transcriptase (RNA-dependent DNA polymerase)
VADVPQGSPIPPLRFSLFIDDMTEVLEFSKYHMFADDLQIYHSRPREMLFECICEVNSDLSRVFEWSLVNSLKLNPSKSMVLPIYKNQ